MSINDDIKNQWKRVKSKGKKDLIKWIMEYWLIAIIIVILIICFVAFLIYTPFHTKSNVFGVTFINASVSEDESEEMEEDFMNYASIDSNKSKISIDLNEILSIGETNSTMDIYTLQSLSVRITAKEIDVLLADAYVFDAYAKRGQFLDLREILDEDDLNYFDDKIYYIDMAQVESLNTDDEKKEESDTQGETELSTDNFENFSGIDEETYSSISPDVYVLPDPSSMEDPIPVGIVCNDASYIKNHHNYDDIVCLFGIFLDSEHLEASKLFLNYLYEE